MTDTATPDFVVCTRCPRYEISKDGTVRHVKTKKLTKIRTSTSGYSIITISRIKRKGVQHIKLHRLLAEAFIPNPDAKPEIDHKDGNRLNNHIDNLRWATRSENQANKRKQANRCVYMRPNGRYYSQTSLDGKQVHIGSFATAEECCKAYNHWVITNGLQEWRPLNVV
jgi:hypothetical protein